MANKILIRLGAQVNTPDKDGKTPLHLATVNGVGRRNAKQGSCVIPELLSDTAE